MRTPGAAARGQETTAVGGVFLAVHLEVSTPGRIEAVWPTLVDFIALADRYGAKVSLQFSAPWARYVFAHDLTDTVRGWEGNGHEIALHHHGPSHTFFDGYTNAPEWIGTADFYVFPTAYQGDMEALLDLLAPLTARGIVSAGMSDAEVDWPPELRYYATKHEAQNSKADLLSVPWEATYDGTVVTAATNAGYAIDHLGDAAVTLADIEAGLQSASTDQIMGIVVNDDTLERHSDRLEPLFALLARYGATPGTTRDVLGAYEAQATPTTAPSAAPTPTTAVPPPTPSGIPEAPPVPFVPVPDVTESVAGGVRSLRIPTTECANVTATPIVVGDWLVYPMHEYSRACTNHGPYQRTLFGYSFRDGTLYLLRDGKGGEAPLLYAADADVLFWNVTFGGTVLLLDPETFAERVRLALGTTSDGAGVFLDGRYYFGTVNSPDPTCQEPLDPNCGALFAVDTSGKVVRQRTTDDGFRAWIGTGLTTDGEFLYIGTAAQTVGEKSGDETEYLYGCSVVKADRDLNILAAFDPGDFACYKLPFQGANEDSVSGEVVPDGTGLWAQYVRPNDSRMVTALYRLNLDLEEQCRVEFEFEPRTQSIGFYGAPTVDRDGYAYVTVSVPDPEVTRRARLLRVAPDCTATTLADLPGTWAQGSATLADDRYVLFATDGRLGIYAFDGVLVREYSLGSPARVLTSPVIHDGTVYVLQEDGTLNIIEDAGVTGYGNAIWPRYRHDNRGSAALAGGASPGPSPTATATALPEPPATPTPTARVPCPGDCNGDATVTVAEIIRAVNIALGRLDLTACPAGDRDHDGAVAIAELIQAVAALLTECPGA